MTDQSDRISRRFACQYRAEFLEHHARLPSEQAATQMAASADGR
jgi:hypothetical protein